jgi:hypothetical protein
MPKFWKFCALLALVLGVFFVFSAPAMAEFFGCHDKLGKVHATYTGTPGQYAQASHTREFSAQVRPRITIHPRHQKLRPNSVRHCRSWLTKEYRLSGPVIVPQMRCWWD